MTLQFFSLFFSSKKTNEKNKKKKNQKEEKKERKIEEPKFTNFCKKKESRLDDKNFYHLVLIL
jgi:hypothetical protein